MQIDADLFLEDGYLVFPAALNQTECILIRGIVDEFEKSGRGVPVDSVPFKQLLFHPVFHDIASTLIGPKRYVFHHMNAACQRAGTPSLGWHNDYERYPPLDNSYKMIHVFLYLSGLKRSIGELLLVPGSQIWNYRRYEYSNLPFDYFNNTVTISELPPGSVVVVNSSLLHARRALEGGETEPRYFIDTSFCEIGGSWFPYMENGEWKTILKNLLKFDQIHNEGAYSFLFDKNQFKMSFRYWLVHTLRLRRFINIVKSVVSPGKGKILFPREDH
jgi:hypothetical protein